MTAVLAASPLTTPVRLVSVEGGDPFTVTAFVAVDADLPLLAGHYPGFPIFPGVCLIECVHQSVLLAAGTRHREVALDQVRGTRFLKPSFPGDELDISVRVAEHEDGWDCRAAVCHDGQDIATVRLGYRMAGGRP
jgi:3-hydroxyacyl-[acyl-carrier-protein] dehydratase